MGPALGPRLRGREGSQPPRCSKGRVLGLGRDGVGAPVRERPPPLPGTAAPSRPMSRGRDPGRGRGDAGPPTAQAHRRLRPLTAGMRTTSSSLSTPPSHPPAQFQSPIRGIISLPPASGLRRQRKLKVSRGGTRTDRVPASRQTRYEAWESGPGSPGHLAPALGSWAFRPAHLQASL